MEKQIGWTCKVSGSESLVISRAGQTVLARLMVESQIWNLLWGCHMVSRLWDFVGEVFRKGTMASACLDARYFHCSLYAPECHWCFF